MIEHRNTVVVIPARMAATRLPGKPMADINGEPMIVHVWRRAVEANIGHVLVAAGEDGIAKAIRDAGGDVILTPSNLPTGSHRAMAALELRDPDQKFDHIVVVPANLPNVEVLSVQRCLAGLTNDPVDIATIAARIEREDDVLNPNIVKAIAPLDEFREAAFARDFVRTVSSDHKAPYWHHIGIAAFRRAALQKFAKLPHNKSDPDLQTALQSKMKIAVVRVDTVPFAVDTPHDLEIARRMLHPKP